ncbi:TetR/AcrR family transcriptional regulator [Bacillus sp. FJAT-50079]|uniref:TetR/AcrR family transcriptional regulator n=1 Tax=Bacillus sp. FJAT-50079 TaxID=2833577 RepID=UPI001BC9239E|nr:TetR/AcrR family transcriptional regulator [Bacillus sp. FJAT-50079]MBS4210038.1 TetR/AcrR family transcriptional regulator [Bacillus sp. FJAT-50079]
MSPRKTASKELTREIILQKARTQFIEKGFQRVSMRSIAKLLDCSHGALYYHFKNKADLFYAIVEEDFAVLNNLIEESIQGPEDDSTKLYQILIRFIEFGINHQSQYEIMFMVRNTEVDSLSQEAANLSYHKFAQTVQALSENKLKIIDIWSAFLALHGFVSHYRGYVAHFDDVKLAAESHVHFIMKGLNG